MWTSEKSAYGIPRLTGKALEQIVEDLLQAHGIRTVLTPTPLGVDDFVQNHLGIRQTYYSLSPQGKYDGAYILRDYAMLPTEAPADGGCTQGSFKSGTMVIDSILLKNEPAYRCAVAHLCAHALLHRDIVLRKEQTQMPGQVTPYFLCRNTDKAEMQTTPAEWQATRFALALLMPRQAVYITTAGMNVHDERSVQKAIHRMMDIFQVTEPAAAYRLRMLLAGDSRSG